MKIAVAIVTSLALVAPALACPNSDHGSWHDETAAPKTADKDKKPAEKADKKTEQKPADTAKAKDTKEAPKKTGDKVSLK